MHARVHFYDIPRDTKQALLARGSRQSVLLTSMITEADLEDRDDESGYPIIS